MYRTITLKELLAVLWGIKRYLKIFFQSHLAGVVDLGANVCVGAEAVLAAEAKCRVSAGQSSVDRHAGLQLRADLVVESTPEHL